MPFLGVLVNVVAVLIGSTIGVLAGHQLRERTKDVMLNALGIGTVFMGVGMALKTKSELLIIGGLIIGGLVGEWMKIEPRLDGLATALKSAVKMESSTFVDGFVTATLLFCVGPMTFIGSFQDGLGDSRLLMIKSLLDAFASLALASALGVGVVFSALMVFIIQGSLGLMGLLMGEVVPPAIITEIGAVGGLMIVGIGINLLGLKKIPVGSFLPALVFTPLFYWIVLIIKT